MSSCTWPVHRLSANQRPDVDEFFVMFPAQIKRKIPQNRHQESTTPKQDSNLYYYDHYFILLSKTTSTAVACYEVGIQYGSLLDSSLVL